MDVVGFGENEHATLAAIRLPRDALEMILKATEPKKLLMVIALWFMWSERSRIWQEGKRRPSEVIASCVELCAKENAMQTNPKPGARGPVRHWKRPLIGQLKVKCDASFHHQEGAPGVGVKSFVTMMEMLEARVEGR